MHWILLHLRLQVYLTCTLTEFKMVSVGLRRHSHRKQQCALKHNISNSLMTYCCVEQSATRPLVVWWLSGRSTRPQQISCKLISTQIHRVHTDGEIDVMSTQVKVCVLMDVGSIASALPNILYFHLVILVLLLNCRIWVLQTQTLT